MGEKYLQIVLGGKGLVSRIYKGFLQFNKRNNFKIGKKI